VLDLIADLLVAADREKAGEVWQALGERLASSTSILCFSGHCIANPDDPCCIENRFSASPRWQTFPVEHLPGNPDQTPGFPHSNLVKSGEVIAQ
jgi:hypothetical protein